MKVFFSFLLVVTVFLLYSCHSKDRDRFNDTLTSGVISVAVDETLKPIINLEIPVFESLYPKAGIVPLYTSELNAVKLLLQDSVRLAIITRPLSDVEMEYLKNKKFEPKAYKIAVDGVALIVNKANTDTLISVDQFRQILTGRITKWKQINADSQLGDVRMMFDNPNSSTVRYAIDSICGKEKFSDKIKTQNTNEEVIDYVINHHNAIGVIGVNWLSDDQDSTNLSFNKMVNVVSISNEKIATIENSYKPFQAYLFYGYYPLIRNIYAIVNDPRSSLPSGFTSFLTSDKGQRIILKSGLLPVTQPIRIVNVREE